MYLGFSLPILKDGGWLNWQTKPLDLMAGLTQLPIKISVSVGFATK